MSEPLRYADVELGDDLPDFKPDVTLETVTSFAVATRMMAPRFISHEGAKKEGLPGAIVPGIMSQAVLAAVIHRWSPGCTIQRIDTIFRALLLVDTTPVCRGVVTDTDDETHTVEIDLTIVNEADETRVIGTAKVELPT